MKTCTAFFAIVSMFIVTNSLFASNNETSKVATKFIATHLFEEEEISVSYNYLNDGTYNYGAHCYLINNTGYAVNVHWSMPDHYNISSSGGFEGDVYIV